MILEEARKALEADKYLRHNTFKHNEYIRFNRHASSVINSCEGFMDAERYWKEKEIFPIYDDGWEIYVGSLDSIPVKNTVRTWHPKKGFTSKREHDEW